MRIKYGTLKKISDESGITVQELSDYAAARKRPGGKRAFVLEDISGVPARIWINGSASQIKRCLNERTGNAA